MTERPSAVSLLAKSRLAFEIATTYLAARRLIRRTNLPATLAKLRAPSRRSSERCETVVEARRLGYAVDRTLCVLPVDSRCLMQALVLSCLLARRGAKTTYVLGVRPGAEFAAHAWVELDGHALMPPREDEFQRLAVL